MTNACIPPITPLHRPWFLRWLESLRPRGAAGLSSPGRHDLDVLEQLSPHTLRDIGAPEWVQSRAQERQDHRTEPLHRLRDGARAYANQGW